MPCHGVGCVAMVVADDHAFARIFAAHYMTRDCLGHRARVCKRKILGNDAAPSVGAEFDCRHFGKYTRGPHGGNSRIGLFFEVMDGLISVVTTTTVSSFSVLPAISRVYRRPARVRSGKSAAHRPFPPRRGCSRRLPRQIFRHWRENSRSRRWRGLCPKKYSRRNVLPIIHKPQPRTRYRSSRPLPGLQRPSVPQHRASRAPESRNPPRCSRAWDRPFEDATRSSGCRSARPAFPTQRKLRAGGFLIRPETSKRARRTFPRSNDNFLKQDILLPFRALAFP